MKKIAIIPNDIKDTGLIQTKRIIDCLSGRVKLYMPSNYSVVGGNINYVTLAELYASADAAIVLGGDGTIIQTAAMCAENDVPVMGVNLGRIGFLAEIETDCIEAAAEKLLYGDYTIEERMMIKAEIIKNNCTTAVCNALNDIVISKTLEEKLIHIGLYSNDELVNSYAADGLIISTPTGSTGYSISAGGPVVDPSMALYVATPICAHMLSARSAVLSADKVIEIKIDSEICGNKAVVTADGDVREYISDSDSIRISKSKYKFKLIKTIKQSFYETLLNKLN